MNFLANLLDKGDRGPVAEPEPSLREQLDGVIAEHDAAAGKLSELEKDFVEKGDHAPLAIFQKLESSIRQQHFVVEKLTKKRDELHEQYDNAQNEAYLINRENEKQLHRESLLGQLKEADMTIQSLRASLIRQGEELRIMECKKNWLLAELGRL